MFENRKIVKTIKCTDINGVHKHNLAYYFWKAKDKKKGTVFCLHALSHNGRMFDYLANDLFQSGFDVICPDMPGRGKSDFMPDPGDYGYPLYIHNIFELISYLNLDKINIVGTSMGGVIGMFIVASEINKKRKLVEKLILNDVGAFIDHKALENIGSYLAEIGDAKNLGADKKKAEKIIRDSGVVKQEHIEHFVNNYFVQQDDENYSLNYDKKIIVPFVNSRGKVRRIPDFAMWDIWQKVDVDTMVIRGENSDVLSRKTMAEMQKNKSVKKVVELNGFAHAPMLSTKKEIDIVKEFLSY